MIDFDEWRRNYSTMSEAEHLEFLNRCEALFPDQAHFNFQAIRKYIEFYPNSRVLEIGGWKGELAKMVMEEVPVASWRNIEPCSAAIDKTVPMGQLPYIPLRQSRFRWFNEPRTLHPDLLISSNTIEHLDNTDLLSLVRWFCGIPHVILEAPLKPHKESWDGYLGSHMLEMDWHDMHHLMYQYGYRERLFLDTNVYAFIFTGGT